MPLTLPVVDLSRAHDPAARRDVASALFDGIAGTACVWVEGHGVPDDVIDAMSDVSRRFFALPRDVKAEVEWDGEGLWRGWQPAIEGGAPYGGDVRKTDLFERLEENFSPALGGVDRQGNRWPSEPPELRHIWERYAEHVGALSCELIRLVAEWLDLPSEPRDPWTTRRSCNLVANYYPAVPPGVTEGRQRLHSHADHSGITVLLLDDAASGLESRTADGDWQQIGYRPGAFLVQAGTLLQTWTNGLLPPNVHRVLPPPEGADGRPDRLTIAWFHFPDRDIVVEPAPSCIGVDGARFTPVEAGSYAASRQAAYRQGQSTMV